MFGFILISFLGPFLIAKLLAPFFFLIVSNKKRTYSNFIIEDLIKMILNSQNAKSHQYRNYSEYAEQQRNRKNFKESNNSSEMTLDEAREILGVTEGDSAEKIKQNYRNLMQKVHPDKGGSEYLCKKINEAKKILSNN